MTISRLPSQWIVRLKPVPVKTENLAPLQAIALAIADLLAGGDLGRIGRCPGHDCGWLFVSHRARRWCSMASCGNRAKVRAHAARQRDRDESVHPR